MRTFFIFCGAIATLLPAVAMAGPDRVPVLTDPLTRKECGICHMAFQPGLLPARSWTAMMDGLADHFGDDASLPPAQKEAIRAVLVAGAGRDRHPDAIAPLRISETGWFVKEHRRITPAVWQRADIKSKANCTACHRQAEQGIYDDD